MKDKIKYLSKNLILFTLSGFVPKLLAFLLIPIYTGYLSTADYGVSDLIISTASLLVPIFTINIQDAVMRFSLDKKYNDADVFSTALRIILKGTLVVSLITIFISFMHFDEIENLYLIFVVIMFITMSLNNTLSLFCRGIDKIKILTFGSILNSLITLLTNILFLVCFKWGLVGFLIANSIGSAINVLYIFIFAKLWKYIKCSVSFQVKKDMLAFSWPLVFSVIAWWVNNVSDRYIVTWMAGLSVSGVYAIAYKIPNLLTMFQNIFFQAWSISAIKDFNKKDEDGFIGKMYTMMNCSMIIICSSIILFNVPIAYILYSDKFFEAWKYVPPLLVSVVFNAMALFIGSLFTAVKDTKTLALSTIIGALVNTVMNFILIHYFRAMGAAVATLLGYVVIFIMRHIILRKYLIMKMNMKRDFFAYIFLLIQMVVSCIGTRYIYISITLYLILLILYKKELFHVFRMLFYKWKE